MQHRPLLGEVLAGRQPRGVVPRLDDLSLRSAPEHDSYTSPHARYCGTSRSQASRVRRRPRAGRGLVPAGDGVERRRGARAGRVVRGAPPHGEGARRRADDRVPARRRRLRPADGDRARRAAASGTAAEPIRREGRDRARGPLVGARRRPRDASRRRREQGVRRRRLRSPRRGDAVVGRDRRRGARAPAHPRGHASLRAGARRARPAGRGRARPDARSTSRRAATRVRSRSRASTTGAASTARCASSRSRATSFPTTTPSSTTRARSSAGSRARLATDDHVLALAYVRVEVPRDASSPPRGAHRDAARLALPAPVAQGIERCPAEAEVACSNHAGRIAAKPHHAYVCS